MQGYSGPSGRCDPGASPFQTKSIAPNWTRINP